MKRIRDSFASIDVYRSSDRSLLGGVCAGLGRRVGLNPWPARLLFTLVLLLLPGSQLVIYPILWVLMPLDTHTDPSTATWRAAASALPPWSARSSGRR